MLGDIPKQMLDASGTPSPISPLRQGTPSCSGGAGVPRPRRAKQAATDWIDGRCGEGHELLDGTAVRARAIATGGWYGGRQRTDVWGFRMGLGSPRVGGHDECSGRDC